MATPSLDFSQLLIHPLRPTPPLNSFSHPNVLASNPEVYSHSHTLDRSLLSPSLLPFTIPGWSIHPTPPLRLFPPLPLSFATGTSHPLLTFVLSYFLHSSSVLEPKDRRTLPEDIVVHSSKSTMEGGICHIYLVDTLGSWTELPKSWTQSTGLVPKKFNALIENWPRVSEGRERRQQCSTKIRPVWNRKTLLPFFIRILKQVILKSTVIRTPLAVLGWNICPTPTTPLLLSSPHFFCHQDLELTPYFRLISFPSLPMKIDYFIGLFTTAYSSGALKLKDRRTLLEDVVVVFTRKSSTEGGIWHAYLVSTLRL